jgi:hypothetical protein
MVMKIKILLLVLLAAVVLAGVVPTANAGVEPAPWMPEINKLYSIELNLGAIHKRMENLSNSPALPAGTLNYVEATVNQTGVLNQRLWDVLAALPAYNSLGTDREEISLALDGIRTDAGGVIDLLELIGRRMGVDPVPWKSSLQAMIIQINNYIGTCPVGADCIP